MFHVTTAQAQWVLTNGPVGGAIRGFAVSGMNLFAGTESGGVSLTTNNGTTWTPINNGLTSTNARSLAVSGTYIFAGTTGGVFRSTNNGESWTAFNTGLTNTSIDALAVSGSSLFAGTYGGGIFRSLVNGTSWTAVNSGLTNLYVNAFAIMGTDIFAGTDGGVFRSTNNGTTWTAINTGLTNLSVYSLAVSGTYIFAGTLGGGVFLSINNGTNWFDVNFALTNPNIRALAVSGTNIFAGAASISPPPGVFLSTNNGTNWTAVNSGLPTAAHIYSLIVRDTFIFAGTNGNAAWRRALSEMITSAVTTNAATSVGPMSATVNGSINPNGAATSAWFEWGTSSSLTTYTSTTSQSIGSGTSAVSVTEDLTGLSANTTYYFRVAAQNSAGTVKGSILSFTTSAISPTVSTLAASLVTASSVTLNGTVNPNGSSTTAYFEWGTSSTLSSYSTTASQSIGSGTNAVSVTANLTGLTPNTTYYYRVVGQNSAGTTRGSIVNFTTSAQIVWQDGFEPYTSGTFPSLWVPDGNATDTQTNYVDGTISSGGTRSLRLYGRLGGNWAAIAYRSLTVSAPFEIELMVRNGNEPMSYWYRRASVGLRKGTNWINPARTLLVCFHNDITDVANNALTNYSELAWYKLRIRYERPTSTDVKVSYWINDMFYGSRTLAALAEEDEMTNFELTVGEGTAWFDDVKVSSVSAVIDSPPTITSFSPTSGPVGTTVTITGTNFGTTTANNIVYFGAVRAQVTAASSTSLSVTLPVGATYHAITVTDSATGLTAYSSNPFVVTFPSTRVIDASSFATKVDFAAGNTPEGVAIGDLDGDGKPDLVVANYGSNSVSGFRNTSTSGSITANSFAAIVGLATGSGPHSVTIADLDGDGKPNLIVTNEGSSTVSVFQNTSTIGNITLVSRVDFTTGTSPWGVAIADIDGDGKPDLAVGSGHSTNQVSTISIHRNISAIGAISFEPKMDLTTGKFPRSIVIGDVDGDGKPDLIAANLGSNTVSVFRNTSSSGNISFASKVDFTSGSVPSSVTIGDVDGDGKPDLVVVNELSNTVSVHRNTSTSGSISFSSKVDFTTGSVPSSVSIGDVDGDGKPDLAVVNQASNTVSVHRNTSTSGSISCTSKVDFTTGSVPSSVTIGDVDGDGKPDLVVANSSSGTISVLRNTMASTSAPTASTSAATNVTSNSATLNGTVNPNGSPTSAYFEWGTSSTLSTFNTTTSQSIAPGTTAVSVSANLTGLSASTTYYYRVVGQNSAGTQRGLIVSFITGTAAPNAPTLGFPANGASAQPTTLTFSWNTVAGATSYRLQVATNSSFNPAVIDDSAITTTSKQVGPLAYNTTYYWRVSAKNAGGSSASSSPSFTFSTYTSKTVSPSMPIIFPGNPTSSTDYRLVSFPGTTSLTVSQVLSGVQNTDWRIFRDNGGSIPNHLTELSSSSSLSVGEGYWLLKKGTFNFSQTVTMPQLSSDGTYTINVRNGWNIIGNPFDVPVPWDLIRSHNSLPSNYPLSSYEGSTTFQSVSTLEPFKGYYFSSSSTSLKIPYPFPSLKIAPSPELPIDWKLQLILETDINSDSQNHIGIAPSAKSDLDELDQPKPPLMFDQGFLYFSRPSWDSRYAIFNSDFRPSLGDGQVWDFEVSNPRESACRIRFNGIEKIPSDYDVILLAERNTTRVDLRERATYEFQPVAEKTPFRLLVGKKPFVEQQMRLLVPKEFELTQNYPNPFNPSTAITYKVPRDAVVRVEVLSVLGQRIAVLAEGFHAPGVYTVTWNATNGTHGSASSGVYFCRLCVDGKPTRTIRMTLLR